MFFIRQLKKHFISIIVFILSCIAGYMLLTWLRDSYINRQIEERLNRKPIPHDTTEHIILIDRRPIDYNKYIDLLEEEGDTALIKLINDFNKKKLIKDDE